MERAGVRPPGRAGRGSWMGSTTTPGKARGADPLVPNDYNARMQAPGHMPSAAYATPRF